MNKLKLFIISVGICSILFTGCGFFEGIFSDKSDKIEYRKASVRYKCIPEDLVERLANKKYYDGFMRDGDVRFDSPEANFKYYTERYAEIFKDDRYDGTGTTKCDDLVTGYYNEAIKKYTDFSIKLPTNIKEEMELEKEWFICDKMPFWLETTLDEYISQNKGDDTAYINASKFKGAWSDKLGGERVGTAGRMGGSGNKLYILLAVSNTNESMAKCVATKTAIKAIENDLIDLGGGKKAKCSDLSYKDAQKCLNYFTSVYNKAYKDKKSELDAEQKEIDIKKERKKYEQINRQ